jgi:hypothetical protein
MQESHAHPSLNTLDYSDSEDDSTMIFDASEIYGVSYIEDSNEHRSSYTVWSLDACDLDSISDERSSERNDDGTSNLSISCTYNKHPQQLDPSAGHLPITVDDNSDWKKSRGRDPSILFMNTTDECPTQQSNTNESGAALETCCDTNPSSQPSIFRKKMNSSPLWCSSTNRFFARCLQKVSKFVSKVSNVFRT